MEAFTKRFEQIVSREGCRYVFYCDLCGCGYLTPLVGKADPLDPDQLAKVQREAKLHFNRCVRCLRWVCDSDYRAESGLCKACADL